LALFFAALIGVPLGAALALWRFRGRSILIVLATSFMALPPVVVGLLVYLLLSRAGPLGSWGLLFTPSAMVIAQFILVLPIIIALTLDAVRPIEREYRELMDSGCGSDRGREYRRGDPRDDDLDCAGDLEGQSGTGALAGAGADHDRGDGERRDPSDLALWAAL